jgi:PhzF family phenazine biosynthesis protein
MSRRFHLVDVFSDEPFLGNPLGVVLDSEGLSTEAMQRITRWLNLSETTFLAPPEAPAADYRVRIFTLERELPFAGHPTLGSCQAWLAAGGSPRDPGHVVQECGAGLIPIRRQGERLAFAAPPLIRSGPVSAETLAEVTTYLGLDPAAIVEIRWVDNGPGWVGVLLDSAEAVLALEPARSHPRRIEVGVVGPYPDGDARRFELRALFTDQHGATREDPVTGSLNASVAQWMYETARAQGPYVAAQGTRIGHAGRIRIDQDAAGQVWIGGGAHILVSGALDF